MSKFVLPNGDQFETEKPWFGKYVSVPIKKTYLSGSRKGEEEKNPKYDELAKHTTSLFTKTSNFRNMETFEGYEAEVTYSLATNKDYIEYPTITEHTDPIARNASYKTTFEVILMDEEYTARIFPRIGGQVSLSDIDIYTVMEEIADYPEKYGAKTDDEDEDILYLPMYSEKGDMFTAELDENDHCLPYKIVSIRMIEFEEKIDDEK